MTDCLFCKIVSGEIPCHKIYEDKNCLAFLDINPVNLGHTLIVPKQHSKNILDINDKILREVIIVVKQLSNKIKKNLQCDGINIMINNESDAGQIILHTHIHIIPRFKKDGFKHWPSKKYKDGEAESFVKKIIEF